MITTEINLGMLEGGEVLDKGFKMFLVTHHFLWTYPTKSSQILASLSEICERNARGENIWCWIRMFAKLKAKKIVWDHSFYDPNNQIFIVAVDGTNFKVWEKKYPALLTDKAQYLHYKFNGGALRYEIAANIYEYKIGWISGPHRGKKHNKLILNEGLKPKIGPGKKVVTD
jgi:hypothetical protein